MSKFGWSYPPGVTESMLPGNSREEREQEAMIESLYEAISPLRQFYQSVAGAADETEDSVVNALEKIVGEAYQKGRADALVDKAMEEETRNVPNPICVGCGEPESRCECDVKDFENK